MNLLPCPSCGSPAIGPKKSSSGDERNGYNFTVTIRCECGFNVSRPSREDSGGWCIDKGEAEAELITLWNKRTPITKLATESVERVPQTMIDRIRGYGRDFAFSGSFAGDMEAVADILAAAEAKPVQVSGGVFSDSDNDIIQAVASLAFSSHPRGMKYMEGIYEKLKQRLAVEDDDHRWSKMKLETCWLVELLVPGSKSLGYYHTGFTDISGNSRSTNNPNEAKKYESRRAAADIAVKLFHLQGVWTPVEHGFYVVDDK